MNSDFFKACKLIRNLDLTALRAFVAIVDAGGVTRAAAFLNLTQSAVSMQIKRLEDMLNLPLFDRSTRKMATTPAGQQLLGYARKMLALNDEVFDRLTEAQQAREIILGVPSDIVHPVIPKVMGSFALDYPEVRLTLISSNTKSLKEQYAQKAMHLILTTEMEVSPPAETLTEVPLVWLGARGGKVWQQRPLRMAFDTKCILRDVAVSVLETQGIPWRLQEDLSSTRAVEASVSADLAVHAALEGPAPSYAERIYHDGALPDLGKMKINMYHSNTMPVVVALAAMIRAAYASQTDAALGSVLDGHHHFARRFAVAQQG